MAARVEAHARRAAMRNLRANQQAPLRLNNERPRPASAQRAIGSLIPSAASRQQRRQQSTYFGSREARFVWL